MDFLGSGNSPTAYRWKAQWLRRRAMMQDETPNGPGYTPKQVKPLLLLLPAFMKIILIEIN